MNYGCYLCMCCVLMIKKKEAEQFMAQKYSPSWSSCVSREQHCRREEFGGLSQCLYPGGRQGSEARGVTPPTLPPHNSNTTPTITISSRHLCGCTRKVNKLSVWLQGPEGHGTQKYWQENLTFPLRSWAALGDERETWSSEEAEGGILNDTLSWALTPLKKHNYKVSIYPKCENLSLS